MDKGKLMARMALKANLDAADSATQAMASAITMEQC